MKVGGFLYTVAYVLVIIGGVNWGLVGCFDFNLVSTVFGNLANIVRLVYVLVGFSAVYLAFIAIYQKFK